MRPSATHIWDIWNAGGPTVGDAGAPHGRVTIDINWFLSTSANYPPTVANPGGGDYGFGARSPYRAFQTVDNKQVEVEMPNVEAIKIDRTVDQDAATCTITMSNQWMLSNGDVTASTLIGQPGFFSFGRGASAESLARWGYVPNAWSSIIVPDALLRTYQGYGGKTKTVLTALADTNIVMTGVWLIDSVKVGTSGKIEITCRDVAKLLVDQQVYPPLAPPSIYPIKYCRWGVSNLSDPVRHLDATPALFGGGSSTPLVHHGTTNYNGAVPQPDFPDYEGNEPGNGYWLLTTDGQVWPFGNNPDYGSLGTDYAADGAECIENTVSGHGYWTAFYDGTIHPFGDAVHYGDATLVGVTGMARNWLGDGYWVLNWTGHIDACGSVSNLGEPAISPFSYSWLLAEIAVSITGDPVGNGYWVMSNQGHVFAFGSAVHYGEPAGATWHGGVIGTHVQIVAHPDGGGYWCIDQVGNVYAYGSALHYGQLAGQAYVALGGTLPFDNPDFPDYMAALIPTPSGKGYWLLGVSGGVYPFGDALHLGGLNAPYEAHLRTDGNYTDYTEIIKELLLWAGFWLGGTGIGTSGLGIHEPNPPLVYGNLETTGAFASECLDETIFDKLAVINPITKIKEIVGYILWVDEEGAVHFESPNIFTPGNFDETGVHIATIPAIDELIQLTDYTVSYADKSERSEIIISTSDPTVAFSDTVTTRFTPPTVAVLRGMIKPAMWINGVFTSKREQLIMAELIALYIWLASRQGSVTFLANPALQINDQVRIWERTTSETYIHYIRGLSSNMDLVAGTYMMTATTHWMGDSTKWAVDIGLEPFDGGLAASFVPPAVRVPLTYLRSSDDLGGSSLHPTAVTDGNLATAWRPRGGTGQLVRTAYEWIELDTAGQTVDYITVYTSDRLNGELLVFCHVMVGGVWQGSNAFPITYQPVNPPGLLGGAGDTPAIPYIDFTALSSDNGVNFATGGVVADKIRITIGAFDNSDWGPFYYLGGIRIVEAIHL